MSIVKVFATQGGWLPDQQDNTTDYIDLYVTDMDKKSMAKVNTW